MSELIAIDVGGSSMRGSLFDLHGRVLKSRQLHYTPEFSSPGRSEQDPQTWVHGLEDILRYLGTGSADSVSCIAITSARSSVIPVDKNGRHLSSAIMWQDRRSAHIVEEFRDMHGFIYDTTGIRWSTMVSAPKILWIRQHDPELYRRTRYFLGIQDFLVQKLSGVFVTDHSFGSRTALMDISQRCWSNELLELYAIDREKLCQLVAPGTICGTLRSSFAEKVGMPAGIPIVSAGGDQQCAALGQGIFSLENMLISTGTGAYLIQGMNEVAKDPRRNLVCNAGAIPDRYILEASMLTAGSVYRWFANLFFHDAGSPAYPVVNEAIAKSPVGARGVMLLPFFEGRGSPFWDPHACGAFFNLSLGTDRADMGRAVLEGIALELKENADAMETFSTPVSVVRSTGGMSVFPLYNQILADCLGKPVIHTDESESTLAGAWMAGMHAINAVSSYEEAFKMLEENRTEYRYCVDLSRHRRYMELLNLRQELYQILQDKHFLRT